MLKRQKSKIISEEIPMLKLMIGVKGTGKTKTLIEMVNNATSISQGAVVCIEKGDKLRYDVKYQARLINTDEFLITDAEALYGFVAGILASNHDVTELFIDSALKICNNDMPSFEAMLDKLADLVAKTGTNLFITSSMPVEDASDTVKKYL